jgi:hypothetical protein
MKKILCFYTFFVFATVINAQVKNTSMTASSVKPNVSSDKEDKKEIVQIIEQWREGYNSGSASKVAALYKEDAYYLTQHFITGIVKGRAAIQSLDTTKFH